MNQKGLIKGIMGTMVLAILVAPFAMATIDRVFPGIPAVAKDNNQTYNVVIIGQDLNHTLSCTDTDSGFDPLVKGDMTVTFSDRNGTFNYSDTCQDSNILVERACGGDFMLNGQTNPANSYALAFSCESIGKTCSLGKCV
ncbi:MAG: hypothetical protein AABW68_05540 [archaeon]